MWTVITLVGFIHDKPVSVNLQLDAKIIQLRFAKKAGKSKNA